MNMSLSAASRLRRFYEQFTTSDRVLIAINADPDAIASAMAVSRLLWHRVIQTAIAHVNVIKRPDNLAMIRLLGVKMQHLDHTDISQYNRFVLVDSQPDHHTGFTPIQPDVVIDHHPDTGACQGPFVDIRPHYGATATILTEYLRAARIKPSKKLATGLFHAIKTDTSNFERHSTAEDMRAFQFLYRHANMHAARKIEQAELEIDFLKYFKLALNDMHLRKNRIFVHLNKVINPDICVLIADFFMRINAVEWSIVSGVYRNALIIVLRNDGLRKDAGKVAATVFGGLGSAGGHKSMARAEISLAALDAEVVKTDARPSINWIVDRIEREIDGARSRKQIASE